MRILVISNELPAPVHRPGSPRPYYFCEEMAKNHELFLGLFCDDREQIQWLSDDPAYRRIFRGVETFPLPSGKVKWWNRQKHRLSFCPYFITRHHHPEYHTRMIANLERLVREKNIDLVYFNAMQMTQYAPVSSGIPIISDVCDCLSLLFRRMAYTEKNRKQKVQYFLESLSMKIYERALAKTFSLLILISKVDEEAIHAVAPHANTLVVPNGVDTAYYGPPYNSPVKNKIVFTGVMSYDPNNDAALYFAEKIFPLVQQKIPDAEFWAVGKEPSEKVRALKPRDGFHVTGTVADIREHLGNARVFVSPLRVGAGMKNKILSAMAMERPIVATSLSLDGIDLVANEDVLVGDTPEEFADQVIRVLKDENLSTRLGVKGRALVTARYSWESAFKILRPALAQLESRKS